MQIYNIEIANIKAKPTDLSAESEPSTALKSQYARFCSASSGI